MIASPKSTSLSRLEADSGDRRVRGSVENLYLQRPRRLAKIYPPRS